MSAGKNHGWLESPELWKCTETAEAAQFPGSSGRTSQRNEGKMLKGSYSVDQIQKRHGEDQHKEEERKLKALNADTADDAMQVESRKLTPGRPRKREGAGQKEGSSSKRLKVGKVPDVIDLTMELITGKYAAVLAKHEPSSDTYTEKWNMIYKVAELERFKVVAKNELIKKKAEFDTAETNHLELKHNNANVSSISIVPFNILYSDIITVAVHSVRDQPA